MNSCRVSVTLTLTVLCVLNILLLIDVFEVLHTVAR